MIYNLNSLLQTNGYWLLKKGQALHYAPPKLPVSVANASTQDRKPSITKLFMGSLKSIIKLHHHLLLLPRNSSIFHPLNNLRDVVYQKKLDRLAVIYSKIRNEQRREEISATPSLGTGMLTEHFPTHCSALSQALCETAGQDPSRPEHCQRILCCGQFSLADL